MHHWQLSYMHNWPQGESKKNMGQPIHGKLFHINQPWYYEPSLEPLEDYNGNDTLVSTQSWHHCIITMATTSYHTRTYEKSTMYEIR
jgi:hypothetical protein